MGCKPKPICEIHGPKLCTPYLNSSGNMGVRYRCNKCQVAYVESNPNRKAAARKRSANWAKINRYTKYGLTVSDVEKMVSAQNGNCAICGNYKGSNLHVDHCHKTGKVRGLLCFDCNTAIGKLGDCSASLQMAVDYLKKSE